MNVGRLAARALIGGLFVGHGMQKLNGSFGGPGLEGATGMMTALGMHPPKRNAVLAGATEAGGGAMLVAGLFTPLASASIIGTMVVAIAKVHGQNGPWATNGGWEYNAVLAGALVAIAEAGPGDLSLDQLRGKGTGTTLDGLVALVLGVASGYAVMELGKRSAPPAAPDEAPAGAPAGDPVTKA